MKLLLVSEIDRHARAVSTITKYIQQGKKLGHEIALFGEQRSESPVVDCSLDVKKFDFVIFVVYQPQDFPDLPYLAYLLDGTPKERRIIIDCGGRYNETVRVEHDFNHLEKLDGHQGWEWIEAFQAVSDKILQPTLNPLRDDVRPFLFHGYDPAAVSYSYDWSGEAAKERSNKKDTKKPYDIIYVGNNWQRWTQMRRFLESIEPIRAKLGSICLVGWDWDKRPDWAVQLGIRGADVDPDLIKRLGVETRWAIPFDEVVDFVGQARFSPIFHRPLFNHLGFVTNRTFETFCADAIPLLMMPEDQIEAIYGTDAGPLTLDDNVAGCLEDMMYRPEVYWDSVVKTRAHLTEHHSYQRRLEELLEILEA